MPEEKWVVALQVWGVLSFAITWVVFKKIGSAWKDSISQLKFLGFLVLFSLSMSIVFAGFITIAESLPMFTAAFIVNGLVNIIFLKLMGYSITWWKVASAFTCQINMAAVFAWKLKAA